MAKYKTLIGRAELIDLPTHFLVDIPAKTDTGAYLSSIHATNIKEYKKSNGKTVLKFNLLGDHSSSMYSREIEVTNYKKATVENSFGQKQERYKVEFKVRLAGKSFRTPFTLADRSTKVFPVLLGRTLLNKRFIVDTAIFHVERKNLKEKLKDWLKKDDMSDDEETVH